MNTLDATPDLPEADPRYRWARDSRDEPARHRQLGHWAVTGMMPGCSRLPEVVAVDFAE